MPPVKVNDVLSVGKSVDHGGSVGRDSKIRDRKSEIDSVVSASPLGQEEEYWKTRQILDHAWVKKTVAELRLCSERMVNRVFILGNLGPKSGKQRGEFSMKIIQHELQQHIHDVPIHYIHDPNSVEFKEKKANDELADNCIYVVENLNFQPHEFGYVEPEVKAPKKVEEVKDETPKEDNSRPLSKGNVKPPPPDKGDKNKKEDSKPVLSDAGKEEELKDVEEAADAEPAPELFNSHTIHQYKKNLGNLGTIYVNDAPLASLTNSNSVSEIKCPQKVMGMKMTEEMRNIA